MSITSAKAEPERGRQSLSTPATAQEQFLRDNIKRYGLLGDNNRVSVDQLTRPRGTAVQEFTQDNHFKFGFDGNQFGCRDSYSSQYWVEYGAVRRSHAGFADELRKALTRASDSCGMFSVTSTRSYIAALISAEATNLGLSFKRVAVDIEGFQQAHPDGAPETDRYLVSWDRFDEFAMEFASLAGCGDPWIAFEAFHGELSDVPHIYDGAEIRIENNNFDVGNGTVAGPPDWCLVDNEKFTAINRYLIARRRRGIPQILRWSPELIAAQLDSPAYRHWLAEASAMTASGPMVWLNQWARLALVRQAFPGLQFASGVAWDRSDQALDLKMKILRRRMKNVSPGCKTQHRYPLWRFARLHGVDYGPYCHLGRDLYGEVDG
jgi:hypothetical protein